MVLTVSKLRQNLSVPITCKIRILPDEAATLHLARSIQDAGCSVSSLFPGCLPVLFGQGMTAVHAHLCAVDSDGTRQNQGDEQANCGCQQFRNDREDQVSAMPRFITPFNQHYRDLNISRSIRAQKASPYTCVRKWRHRMHGGRASCVGHHGS